MPGMKRFVTYIYAYEDKKKGSNTGFAKVEIRGGDGRMEIHLRAVYAGDLACKVYLFAVDGADMDGVPIGEMYLKNGAGDFFTVFKVENLNESAVNFFSMEGLIIIGGEEQIFMSRWKEGRALEVSLERFRPWNAAEAAREEKIKNVDAGLPETAEQGHLQEVKQAPQSAEIRQDTDETGERPRQNIEEAKEENMAATEIPMRNIFVRYDWQRVWENLKATHENFILYREEEIGCVKIELKDIRELPRRYWYLGNNSFLLHGFFNYRYLAVGKIGEERWFLGVPGIYQNQERVMAAIFGFPEFLPEPLENHFGYWCRMIEE